MNDIISLLKRLEKMNAENDFGGLLAQTIEAAEPLQPIPSLAEKVRLPLTPMMTERFKFCGTWINAAASQTWLGLSDGAKALKKRRVQKQVSLRLENWPQSQVAHAERGSVALFGIDEDDGEETYLIFFGDR